MIFAPWTETGWEGMGEVPESSGEWRGGWRKGWGEQGQRTGGSYPTAAQSLRAVLWELELVPCIPPGCSCWGSGSPGAAILELPSKEASVTSAPSSCCYTVAPSWLDWEIWVNLALAETTICNSDLCGFKIHSWRNLAFATFFCCVKQPRFLQCFTCLAMISLRPLTVCFHDMIMVLLGNSDFCLNLAFTISFQVSVLHGWTAN